MEIYQHPTLTCYRCGHSWHPRGTRKPLKCPLCTSTLWDVPRDLNEELGIQNIDIAFRQNDYEKIAVDPDQ